MSEYHYTADVRVDDCKDQRKLHFFLADDRAEWIHGTGMVL
jgi:hypothetical protein